MELSEDVIRSIATNKPQTVERVLLILRSKIDKVLLSERNRQVGQGQYSDRPEADQPEMEGYLRQHHSQHDGKLNFLEECSSTLKSSANVQ